MLTRSFLALLAIFAQRASFVSSVLAPLDALAAKTAAIEADVEALGLGEDAWVGEVLDGIAVDAARAAFIHAAYRAAVSLGDGAREGGWLGKADAALAKAGAVVARRHGRLHDPDPRRLLDRGTNVTLYGYLNTADTLCYWVRERADLGNAAQGTSAPVPSCVF